MTNRQFQEKTVFPLVENHFLAANISGTIRWPVGSLFVSPTVDQVRPLFMIHGAVSEPTAANAFASTVNIATGYIESVGIAGQMVLAKYRIVTSKRDVPIIVTVEATEALERIKIVPAGAVGGGVDLVFSAGNATVTLTSQHPTVDGVDFEVAYSPPPR
ncbi:MAG TPA: hypothetical protein VIK27_11850 [Candidatus Aquilonibacter sp.]